MCVLCVSELFKSKCIVLKLFFFLNMNLHCKCTLLMDKKKYFTEIGLYLQKCFDIS